MNLSTKLNTIHFSEKLKKTWSDNTSQESSAYGYGTGVIPSLEKLILHSSSINYNLFELFKYVSDLHTRENYHPDVHKDATIKILKALNKDGINLEQILLETKYVDPDNEAGWQYETFFNIYLKSLIDSKKEINPILLEQCLLEIETNKKYSSYQDIDSEINTFFDLLEVIPKNQITYEWFNKKLELFCTILDDESREMVNNCNLLNFDSQTKIYNYISTNFPEKISENEKYYQDLLLEDNFITKNLYQGVIKINLFKVLAQFNLKQENLQNISNIIGECLNVTASSEFMKEINENITVSNIDVKQQHNSMNLQFSTENHEDLIIFEDILLKSLNGVLKMHEKIKISWSESFSGEDHIITNMDAKFVAQQYLVQKLNHSLLENKIPNRKHKV